MWHKAIAIVLVIFLFAQRGNGQNDERDSLRVLTWNLFLRPAIMPDQQMQRAPEIAKFLKTQDVEVLVLQECFHKNATNFVLSDLQLAFPYQSSTGERSEWGLSSGVRILSKLPFQQVQQLYFSKGIGIDKIAEKGVQKVQLKKGNQAIEIFGTHAQSGSGIERRETRRRQYFEMMQMAEASNTEQIIQIFAGDFNTYHQSTLFNWLCKIYGLISGTPLGPIFHTCRERDHKLKQFQSDVSPGIWIDFVLLRKGKGRNIGQTRIFEPTMAFKYGRRYLSDHLPLSSTIYWKK